MDMAPREWTLVRFSSCGDVPCHTWNVRVVQFSPPLLPFNPNRIGDLSQSREVNLKESPISTRPVTSPKTGELFDGAIPTDGPSLEGPFAATKGTFSSKRVTDTVPSHAQRRQRTGRGRRRFCWGGAAVDNRKIKDHDEAGTHVDVLLSEYLVLSSLYCLSRDACETPSCSPSARTATTLLLAAGVRRPARSSAFQSRHAWPQGVT